MVLKLGVGRGPGSDLQGDNGNFSCLEGEVERVDRSKVRLEHRKIKCWTVWYDSCKKKDML